jgi:hypothetical protein
MIIRKDQKLKTTFTPAARNRIGLLGSRLVAKEKADRGNILTVGRQHEKDNASARVLDHFS